MNSRINKRYQAQINVVPYIDVMLVLLIIFMVTAPLLNLGVEIELPDSNAKPMESKQEPLIINVTAGGDYYIVTSGEPLLVDSDELVKQVSAYVNRNPDMQVLVGGDQQADYGTVYEAMVLLQQAGVPKLGLISDPEE